MRFVFYKNKGLCIDKSVYQHKPAEQVLYTKDGQGRTNANRKRKEKVFQMSIKNEIGQSVRQAVSPMPLD